VKCENESKEAIPVGRSSGARGQDVGGGLGAKAAQPAFRPAYPDTHTHFFFFHVAARRRISAERYSGLRSSSGGADHSSSSSASSSPGLVSRGTLKPTDSSILASPTVAATFGQTLSLALHQAFPVTCVIFASQWAAIAVSFSGRRCSSIAPTATAKSPIWRRRARDAHAPSPLRSHWSNRRP
jgi:hypothetical protein